MAQTTGKRKPSNGQVPGEHRASARLVPGWLRAGPRQSPGKLRGQNFALGSEIGPGQRTSGARFAAGGGVYIWLQSAPKIYTTSKNTIFANRK